LAIKGISDVRRMPRLGKIRLGVRETSRRTGGEFPRAVDYFVCNPDQSTSEAAAEAFHAVYGDRPKELEIMFPVDDREKFFEQWYRRYGSGTGLLCKGDGETAVECDRETGEIREVECEPCSCEWLRKKHCRPVGTLQFLLYRVPGLGVWQIDTSSYYSIVNINSAVDFIKGLTGGRIAMIPLKLVVRPKEVTVEGRKKVIYVLDLACEQIRLEEVLRAARAQPARLALPGVDFDKAPDDLYPASLIAGEALESTASPGQPPGDGVTPPDDGRSFTLTTGRDGGETNFLEPLEAGGCNSGAASRVRGEGAEGPAQPVPLAGAPEPGEAQNALPACGWRDGEGGGSQPDAPCCASCGVEVSPGVSAYSSRRFGRTLCMECQKGEKGGAAS
jgi:hypothetical protein